MEYKNCKLCKCQFVNKKRGVGRNIYCSLNCLHKSKIKPKIDIKCSFCGKINAVNAKKAKSLTKTGLKFCDINCKNKAQGIGKILQPSHYGTNKDIKNKNCLCCNIDLIKNCKLFCSKKCQNNYDYNKFINNWKNKEISGNIKNQVLSVYIRRYMLDKFEHKCSNCGWNKVSQKNGKIPFTINHIGTKYTPAGHLFPYIFIKYFAALTIPLAFIVAIYLRFKYGNRQTPRSEQGRRERLESDVGALIMALPFLTWFFTRIFISLTQ